jgi:hypothetical protein
VYRLNEERKMFRWTLTVLALMLAFARTAGWFGSPYEADGALVVIMFVATLAVFAWIASYEERESE